MMPSTNRDTNNGGNDNGGDEGGGTRAMALFNRFNAMSGEISSTRAKRDALEGELDEIRREVGRLKKREVRLKQETREHDDRTTSLEAQIRDVEDRYGAAIAKLQKASLEEERMRRELDSLQDAVSEQRQSFLDGSRKFRSKCHELRGQASALGLHCATEHAFAVANGFDGRIFEELADDDAVSDDDDVLRGDPLSEWRVVDDDDEEMQQCLEAYRQEKDRLAASKEALKESQKQRQALLDEGTELRERKQKLQSQWERIGNETVELESEIRKLQEQQHAASRSKNCAFCCFWVLCYETSSGPSDGSAVISSCFRSFQLRASCFGDAISLCCPSGWRSPAPHPQSLRQAVGNDSR